MTAAKFPDIKNLFRSLALNLGIKYKKKGFLHLVDSTKKELTVKAGKKEITITKSGKSFAIDKETFANLDELTDYVNSLK